MSDERNKKIYDFIKGNLINLVVILTSVAYIFFGMIGINKTDLTIEEQIAKAGIGIIVGFLIKQGVGENGFNKGYNSLLWKTALEKYNNVCNIANAYVERVDNFYRAEEIEKKRQYRRMLLMEYQIKYEWFFDFKGNFIENKDKYSTLDRKQRRALKKAVKVKIYNLNLFSEYSIELSADTKREKTDKTQRSIMFGKNGIAQIVSAVLGAYFLPMWSGWSWASFIIASIQVVIWISCGVIQLYTNYNYVAIEKTNKLKRKMELLIKFKQGCESGLYATNPYDDSNIEVNNAKERINNEVNTIPNV